MILDNYKIKLLGGSLLAHIVFAVCLVIYAHNLIKKPAVSQSIKIRIAENKPKPEIKMEKPVTIPKIEKKKPPKPKSERKPESVVVKNTPPVQGLSASALSATGKGISAPVGNTLLQKDEGKRLKPEDVHSLEQDLSAEATLIRSTFRTPDYTQPALFAQLQGIFAVDVFVDKNGNPVDVDLIKSVGYDMDQRIKEAILHSKFLPKKDKTGETLDGWTEVKVKLEIHNS